MSTNTNTIAISDLGNLVNYQDPVLAKFEGQKVTITGGYFVKDSSNYYLGLAKQPPAEGEIPDVKVYLIQKTLNETKLGLQVTAKGKLQSGILTDAVITVETPQK